MHRDPVVKRLKRIWPCDTPDCDPWNANQSIIVLLPSGFLPLCLRQALKWLVVTSSIQIKAKSWIPDDLFPWLIEANTLTGVPSVENLPLNETYWHFRSSSVNWMSIFPFSEAWKNRKIELYMSYVIFEKYKNSKKMLQIVLNDVLDVTVLFVDSRNISAITWELNGE